MPIRAALVCLTLAVSLSAPPGFAQGGDDIVVQAREALRRKDRNQLAAARQAAAQANHPLAGWVDYWELLNRLDAAQQPELDAFSARWAGSYVDDRMRNDWLLELGRRRDWANFRVEFPRFRMNDDREVTCYALLTQHLDGQEVRDAARSAWMAQRDADDGCALLASTLFGAGVFTAADVWPAARQWMEANRPRAVRAALALLGPEDDKAAAEIIDNPGRFLARRAAAKGQAGGEAELLAIMKLAAADPEQAAARLDGGWGPRLPMALAATAWAHVGKQSALKLQPAALGYARRAWELWDAATAPAATPPWSDELLAWQVRAALRAPVADAERWQIVQRAVSAMSTKEQDDPAWVYWKARAVAALARPGPGGEADRAAARKALEALARPFGFYGRLAAEDLGLRLAPPTSPAAPTPAERDAARALPGLKRALQLIELGLRSEGVREWNYTLRGMSDRELLAASQLACQREVWDRCINTSERTRESIDIAQRYPQPFAAPLQAQAQASGVDASVLFGLVRQESRFVVDARSSVGAAGLMQLMPATAAWTARRVGLEFRPSQITDRDVNLRLGAAYLRRVLDTFGGSLPMAVAAYNAGPSRVRRWRDGPAVEAAAWIEGIPFNETRDYVKKVVGNSVEYAALLGQPATLKGRLGPAIGPREDGEAPGERDLP